MCGAGESGARLGAGGPRGRRRPTDIWYVHPLNYARKPRFIGQLLLSTRISGAKLCLLRLMGYQWLSHLLQLGFPFRYRVEFTAMERHQEKRTRSVVQCTTFQATYVGHSTSSALVVWSLPWVPGSGEVQAKPQHMSLPLEPSPCTALNSSALRAPFGWNYLPRGNLRARQRRCARAPAVRGSEELSEALRSATDSHGFRQGVLYAEGSGASDWLWLAEHAPGRAGLRRSTSAWSAPQHPCS